jgi:hypothetical protein
LRRHRRCRRAGGAAGRPELLTWTLGEKSEFMPQLRARTVASAPPPPPPPPPVTPSARLDAAREALAGSVRQRLVAATQAAEQDGLIGALRKQLAARDESANGSPALPKRRYLTADAAGARAHRARVATRRARARAQLTERTVPLLAVDPSALGPPDADGVVRWRVDLPPGERHALPATLDTRTLRGEVPEGAEVIGMASELTNQEQAADPRARALRDALDKIQGERRSSAARA